MFLHKEGHYSLDSTPLALLWKDAHCSQYVLETEGDGTVPDQQVGPLPACGNVPPCASHSHVMSARTMSLCAPASTLPACFRLHEQLCWPFELFCALCSKLCWPMPRTVSW